MQRTLRLDGDVNTDVDVDVAAIDDAHSHADNVDATDHDDVDDVEPVGDVEPVVDDVDDGVDVDDEVEPVVMQAKLLSGAQLSLTAITREAGQVVNLIQVIIMMINVNVDSHNQGFPCAYIIIIMTCSLANIYTRYIQGVF